MKLEKWALIAEIVGTIAVVATLIILVIGIRENTEATRVASFDAATQSINDWRSDMLDDPDLFAILQDYNDGVIPSAERERRRPAKRRLPRFDERIRCVYGGELRLTASRPSLRRDRATSSIERVNDRGV